MSTKEAQAYIGKKISVSDEKVIYGDLQCAVAKKNERNSVGGLIDIPGFPYSVWYECQNKKVFVPGFSIGKSCSHILSGLDGWTLHLRRAKAQ